MRYYNTKRAVKWQVVTLFAIVLTTISCLAVKINFADITNLMLNIEIIVIALTIIVAYLGVDDGNRRLTYFALISFITSMLTLASFKLVVFQIAIEIIIIVSIIFYIKLTVSK